MQETASFWAEFEGVSLAFEGQKSKVASKAVFPTLLLLPLYAPYHLTASPRYFKMRSHLVGVPKGPRATRSDRNVARKPASKLLIVAKSSQDCSKTAPSHARVSLGATSLGLRGIFQVYFS